MTKLLKIGLTSRFPFQGVSVLWHVVKRGLDWTDKTRTGLD